MNAPDIRPCISRRALLDLQEREAQDFRSRTQQSAELMSRGTRSMVQGVPVRSMGGLFRHPPLYLDNGADATFWDIDGNAYTDFDLADLAMTMGYGNSHISAAAAEALDLGAHFMFPIKETPEVSEALADRTGVPFWQITETENGAITDVVRIARALTMRPRIMVFDGYYRLHPESSVRVNSGGPSQRRLLGLGEVLDADIVIVPFNDIDAAACALQRGDIAIVIVEPILCNRTLVQAAPGFLHELHALAQRNGSLFCVEEVHSFCFAYGGLTRAWGLPCDLLLLGKGLGSGYAFGLIGMHERIAARVEAITAGDSWPCHMAEMDASPCSAITVFVARAALEHVLTRESHARIEAFGARLAGGLQQIFDDLELPWRALHFGPRSGYCLSSILPRNARETSLSIDRDFTAARHLYMANRGVWDGLHAAGPQISFAHNAADVDQYLDVANEFLQAIRS